MASKQGIVGARLALRWLIVGEWRAYPARLVMTAIAIAVGVALGFAVHLINGSALNSFEGALHTVNGAADLQVVATSPLGFDEKLYSRVANAKGVSDVSPVVVLDARIGSTAISVLGLDVIRAAQVTPSLVGVSGSIGTGNATAFDSDALFLSRSALAKIKGQPGKTVMVRANGFTAPLRIAGVLPGVGDEQSVGVIDIAAAQWRFGRLGKLDRIDVKQAEGFSSQTLGQLLPPDAVIATGATVSTRSDALSRAYRVNLDVLALVALLTGGFLVYSAQSLSVSRRLRGFALVRTLGLSRQGIVATVAIEGLVIGLAGAGIGIGVGYALAYVALTRFGGDLGAQYFAGGRVALNFEPLAAAGFFLLGVAAAVGSSVIPALDAGRAAPAVALRNAGDAVDPRTRVAWVPAALLIVVGCVAALLPAIAGLPLFGFGALAAILAGGVAGMPWLARALLAPLARRGTRTVPLDLAVRHLHGAPRQAATALSGIVASTALMIAMAVMVTSFRGAVDQWLGQILSSDLYLRAENGIGLDVAAQRRLATTPGVQQASFSRQIPLTLAADRPPVMLIARSVAKGGADPTLVLIGGVLDGPLRLPVWVSEPAARIYHWRVGDVIALPIGGRFTVAGIWRDYARQQGALVIRDSDYTHLTGDASRSEAAVTLAPGADPRAISRALVSRAPALANLSVTQPAALRRYALELFDRSFAVTYLLEAVAILVGLAGVAATMSAQTIARTREFGMLRHIGVLKRQITLLLACEGGLLGFVGGVAGISLGGVMAQVLIHVINPQSFNWTMATIVPWQTIIGVMVALVVAAAGTAVIAGRRATVVDTIQAVREDW